MKSSAKISSDDLKQILAGAGGASASLVTLEPKKKKKLRYTFNTGFRQHRLDEGLEDETDDEAEDDEEEQNEDGAADADEMGDDAAAEVEQSVSDFSCPPVLAWPWVVAAATVAYTRRSLHQLNTI